MMRRILPGRIVLIAGLTIAILLLYFLQNHFTNLSSIWFLVIFQIIFFTVSELINTRLGIYTAVVSIVFTILYALNWSRGVPGDYFVLITLLALYVSNYLIVKALRIKRLEQASGMVKHFRSLANYSMQPLILKDKNGSILFASTSIKNLLSLNSNLKVGADISNYIHPDDIKEHAKFLKSVNDNPFEVKTMDVRMLKGKEYIWVKNSSINLLEHKHIKAIVTSLQDINFQKEIDNEKSDILRREKRARELAEKTIKDRDEFLSIASHELKTPLTSILLQLQATLRNLSTKSLAEFSGQDLLKSLKIAEKQSVTLSVLIKDLLDVSLASTGRITLSKEELDLVKLVKSVLTKYNREIDLSNSKVDLKINTEKIIGHWDPVRLEQAIANLLMNALKYGMGEKIKITLAKKDNDAYFRIKDYGIGISENMQKNIFKPFKRANNDNAIKGLGVGLFISQQIAKSHGGIISIKSKAKKGSTFVMRLPLNDNSKQTSTG